MGDKISTCIYIAAILSDFLHQLNEELAENERRGLTSVLGFGAAPAVVVVDFARVHRAGRLDAARGGFLGRDRGYDAGGCSARAAGIPVYYTAAVYEEPDLADAGIWAKKVPASVTLRAGTPGSSSIRAWGAARTRRS